MSEPNAALSPEPAEPHASAPIGWRTRLADALRHPQHLIDFALFWGIVLFATRPMIDNDIWWHLRTGQWICEHRSFPWQDMFSWTAEGRPWIAYSWGFDLLAYGASRAAGLDGLIGVRLLLLLATMVLVRRALATLTGHGVAATLITSWIAITMGATWTTRPHLFTQLMMACFVLSLWAFKTGSRRQVWILPALMVVWANTHIQFVYGLGLVGLMLVGEWVETIRHGRSWKVRVAPLLVVLGLCAAASLANPYGYHVYEVALTFASHRVPQQVITELAPTAFTNPWTLALLVLVMWVAIGVARRALDWTVVLWLLAVGVFAVRQVRDTPYAVILLVPLVGMVYRGSHGWVRRFCEHVERDFAQPRGGKARVVANTAILVVMVALLPAIRVWKYSSPTLEQEFPVQAAQHIRRNVHTDRLISTFNWGGYLIWELYPTCRVSIDGRTQLYGDAALQAFCDALMGRPSWREYMDQLDSDWALLPRDRALAELLRLDAGWHVAYEDDRAVLFQRVSLPNGTPSTRSAGSQPDG